MMIRKQTGTVSFDMVPSDFYGYFRSRDFTHTGGMRAIGGRNHYRETRTHSAEFSPNSV